MFDKRVLYKCEEIESHIGVLTELNAATDLGQWKHQKRLELVRYTKQRQEQLVNYERVLTESAREKTLHQAASKRKMPWHYLESLPYEQNKHSSPPPAILSEDHIAMLEEMQQDELEQFLQSAEEPSQPPKPQEVATALVLSEDDNQASENTTKVNILLHDEEPE